MSGEAGGYSTLNVKYLAEKWETANEYFDGAVEVPGRKNKVLETERSKSSLTLSVDLS